ncbi:Rrp1p NDAI_0A03500 [Naumovozyma dairenensis CBS 421]|uniref:Ribosomal RNA-processing protein 1 n=1 Tax=Naumovozyma dairenensis (strain ATCC 10597 / BCRC 20456 / CBS 421 / NBRC 0211 / NRRL Y-12639) TaxID=1071378 RepID=G0W3W9_NAUDC|nr:hypothetical protein NDAI_0A03500 [Naumovozyma dairenensis CBS 421]CCD22507.1 hypothetical protein NDAI_0A03500 [Naumovozyma dairenensis CBS 421]
MNTSTFVKQLSSNNRVVREKSLEALEKVLVTEKCLKTFKQSQFNKLWKGLYFAMWFSDRPRPQQRLANKLGELYQLYFNKKDNENYKDDLSINDEAFVKFSKAFWKVLCLEWYNIDRFRMDKYLLLVRRVFFSQIKYLKLREWNEKLVNEFIETVLKDLPLSGSPKVYSGIPFHIIDIVLDEWERLFTEKNDEIEDNEDEEEEKQETELIELVKNSPLKDFISIFQDLASNMTNSKILRDKIKEDLLADERLVKWAVIEREEVEKISASKGATSSKLEDEEWHGF